MSIEQDQAWTAPQRSNSPIPQCFLDQSQQRAAAYSARGHVQLTPPQGCPAFGRSLQQLSVGKHKPSCSEPSAEPPKTVDLTYSTDKLLAHSTPHGSKYSCSFRSAGSSPTPGSCAPAAEHAECIAAAWLQQQQQQPAYPPTRRALAASLGSSTGSRVDAADNNSHPSPHHLQLDKAAMDRIIKDPISHLLPHHSTSSGTATATASQPASTSIAIPQFAGDSSPSASRLLGMGVFCRNSAIALEQKLQQVLPAGQLLTAQEKSTQAWHIQQQRQYQQQYQAEPALAAVCQQQQELWDAQAMQQQQQHVLSFDVLSQELLPWQRHLGVLMDQLTQQVSCTCVEHGRMLASLQERYAELANALFMGLNCLCRHHAVLTAVAQAATSMLTATRTTTTQLQRQLAAEQAAAQQVQQQLDLLSEQHNELVQDTQQTIQQLQQLVVSLKQQLWQTRAEHEQQQAAADEAAARDAEDCSRRLAAADDEVCSLKQRLAFVHEQLAAVRSQLKAVPEVRSAAAQTEAEQAVAPEEQPGPVQQQSSTTLSEDDTGTDDTEEDAPGTPWTRELLEYAGCGVKRSRLWLVKMLGQVTADKAVADAVADRQGVPRCSMKDFIPTWSLTRYGLQHLSDQVLGELCCSICHYAPAGLLPARWFAAFCQLGPAVRPNKKQRLQGAWQLPGQAQHDTTSSCGSTGTLGKGCGPQEAEVLLSSPAAADFWVFCASQLAYPNSVVALFPEAQEALPLVRSSLVMESIKAAFRYLGGSGQAQFVAEKLEAAAVPDNAARLALAGDKGNSRPATSGGITGRFGYYNAWQLLDLLLAEWLIRAWAKAQSMAQLRREVNSLQPPLQQQYETAISAVSAAGPAHAALLNKLQDAHATLQPHLGALLSPAPQLHAAADTSEMQQQPPVEKAHLPSSVKATTAVVGDISSTEQGSLEASVATQLLQDATVTDVDGVCQSYKLLLSLVQLAHVVGGRPDDALHSNEHEEQPQSEEGARLQPAFSQGLELSPEHQQQLVHVAVTTPMQGASSSSPMAAANKIAQQLAQPGGLQEALAAARQRQRT